MERGAGVLREAITIHDGALVRFRFRAAVFVGDFVFLEHLGHFLGDHVAIVRNGDDGELFSQLGFLCGRRLIWLFGCVSHDVSIHWYR